MQTLLTYQFIHRHRLIVRMLISLVLLMTASSTWADQKTATWDAHADSYERNTPYDLLSTTNGISVSAVNLRTSKERPGIRNFQFDNHRGSITVTAPTGYRVYQIYVHDDYKNPFSKASDGYSISSSNSGCTVKVNDNTIPLQSVTVNSATDTNDGTNFQILEVICVQENPATFAKTSYTINGNTTVATSLNNFTSDMSVTYESGSESLATVNTSGVVTGVAEGATTITAKIKGGSNYTYKEVTTSVTVDHSTTFDSDGLCSSCHTDAVVQSATKDSQGRYEINNIGKLCWFRNQVNSGNNKINGILTANIDMSKVCSAKLGKSWEPIGNYNGQKNTGIMYQGTFDGNNHTIVGLYINSSNDYQALFGNINEASIRNLDVKGDVTVSAMKAAIIVAYDVDNSIIQNCVSRGTVSCSRYYAAGILAGGNARTTIVTGCTNYANISGENIVGGIIGGYAKTVSNCMNVGTISATGENGESFSIGYNIVILSNCLNVGTLSGSAKNNTGSAVYYLASTDDGKGGKTAAQLKSGEVAFLLNNSTTSSDNAWHQTLGTDAYPTLDATHSLVYQGATNCVSTEFVYRNDQNLPAASHSTTFDSDGLCSFCHTDGSVQPATKDSQGRYEINNIGKLCWFRNQVNSGNTSINGILTADIDMSKVCSAKLGKSWEPIGTYDSAKETGNRYKGTFDGNNHTIVGLYIYSSNEHQALFGNITNASIKNLDVKGDVTITGSNYQAAIIVAYTHNSCIIQNCVSRGTVSISRSYAAGIAAYGKGSTITGCTNYANISGVNLIGGIVGGYANNVTNCMNIGTISATGNYGDSFSIGDEITNLSNCLNVGTLSGTTQNNTGTAVYYLASTDDGKGGKTAAQLKSGEVAFLLNNSTTSSDNAWHQTLGTDAYPTLDATHSLVYQGATNCARTEFAYRNDQNFPAASHANTYDSDGLCSGCHTDAVTQPLSTTQTIDGKTFYEIANVGQLCSFRNMVNAATPVDKYRYPVVSVNAILTADIDLSCVCYKASEGKAEKNWTPILSKSFRYYAGHFKGNGKKITGLYINKNCDYAGLFGSTKWAIIEDLDVTAEIHNGQDISDGGSGIICSYNGGYIYRCVSRGTIEAYGQAGGICAANKGYVEDCVNYADISKMGNETHGWHTGNYMWGGICGITGGCDRLTYEETGKSYDYGRIKNCINYGSVKGETAGGICAYGSYTDFVSNLNLGTVEGIISTAAIIADNTSISSSGYHDQVYTTITNCFSKSLADGVKLAVYEDDAQPTITDCAYVTDAQLKSGEILSRLGTAWGQCIGSDENPTLADATRANEDNYVYGKDGKFYCQNLILNDDLPLYMPLKAGAAKYTRAANNKTWGTLCLPYSFTADANTKYYKKARIEGQKVVLTAVGAGETIEAGTPLIIETADGSLTISGTDKSLVAAAVPSNGDMEFKGSFTPQTLDATTASEDIYYISGDKLWRATGTLNVKPYRAWFTLPRGSGAKSYNLVIDDVVNSVESLESRDESDDAPIYNLQGQRVGKDYKGVVIKNGKKTVK